MMLGTAGGEARRHGPPLPYVHLMPQPINPQSLLKVPVRYAFAAPRETAMAGELSGGFGSAASITLSKRGSGNGTNSNNA